MSVLSSPHIYDKDVNEVSLPSYSLTLFLFSLECVSNSQVFYVRLCHMKMLVHLLFYLTGGYYLCLHFYNVNVSLYAFPDITYIHVRLLCIYLFACISTVVKIAQQIILPNLPPFDVVALRSFVCSLYGPTLVYIL